MFNRSVTIGVPEPEPKYSRALQLDGLPQFLCDVLWASHIVTITVTSLYETD